MKTVQKTNGIKLSFGEITVDMVGPNQYNDKKDQAQLRQLVTTIYPAARGKDSLSDALFNDFGEGDSYTEKRVTWIPIPKGTSKEQVEAMLRTKPNAVLHRILSLNPILTDEQINAMESGVSSKTMEDYAEKFVIDPETKEPVLYKGEHLQYREIKFRSEFIEDEDRRSADLDEKLGRVSVATAKEVVPTGKVEQI